MVKREYATGNGVFLTIMLEMGRVSLALGELGILSVASGGVHLAVVLASSDRRKITVI